MWDEIEKQMRGTDMGARIKVVDILTSYDGFKAREGELLERTYYQYCNLLNELRKNGIQKTDVEINLKFLNNLRPEWNRFTLNLTQIKDKAKLSNHVLYESLNQYQDEVLDSFEYKKVSEKSTPTDPFALVSEKKSKSSIKSYKHIKQESESSGTESEGPESDSDMQDLKKALVLLTKAFQKKFYKKPSSNNLIYGSSSRRNDSKDNADGGRGEV